MQARQVEQNKRADQQLKAELEAFKVAGETPEQFKARWEEKNRAELEAWENDLEQLRQQHAGNKISADLQQIMAEGFTLDQALAIQSEGEQEVRDEARNRRREQAAERRDKEKKRAAGERRRAKAAIEKIYAQRRKDARAQARKEAGYTAPDPTTESERLKQDLERRDRQEKHDRKKLLRVKAWKELRPLMPRKAWQMSQCERTGRQFTCRHCGSQGTVPLGCDVRGCPVCDSEKASTDAAIYSPMFEDERPRFITFTGRNVDLAGDDLAGDAAKVRRALRELTANFHRLRAHSYMKPRLRGGLWKREATFKSSADGARVWVHPHLHCLYFGQFIPQAELSQRWEARTGCPIVDIRRPPPIREIVKYAVKAYNYDQDKKRDDGIARGESFETISEKTGGRFTVGYLLAVWLKATRHLHLVRTFGDGWKAELPEADAICPDCAASDWLIESVKIPYYSHGPPPIQIWRPGDLYPVQELPEPPAEDSLSP